MKLKLVDDVRNAWKWFSTWIFGALTVVPLAWPAIPAELKAALPQDILPYVSGVAFVGLILRLVQQSTPTNGGPQ